MNVHVQSSRYSASNFVFDPARGEGLVGIHLSHVFTQVCKENGQEKSDQRTFKDFPYTVDQLRKIIGYACSNEMLNDFNARVQKATNEVAAKIFQDWSFEVDWARFPGTVVEIEHCHCSLCNLERRVDQEKKEGAYQPYNPSLFLDTLAEAFLEGKKAQFSYPQCSEADQKWAAAEVAKNLGPKMKHKALRWIQEAIQKRTEESVQVELHPEWLRQRGGKDWLFWQHPKTPPSLQVTIGNQKPRTLTLWPEAPFLVVDGYYPDITNRVTNFTPLRYRFKQGNLCEILLTGQNYSSIRDTWSHEEWIRVHELKRVIAFTCREDVQKGLADRLRRLEASSAQKGCVLEKTLNIFRDWSFSIFWINHLPLGERYSGCLHTLCHLEFQARCGKGSPFTVKDYARAVAQALVCGGQPEIPVDRASHNETFLAVNELYRIVGPEPCEGLPLLNALIQESGGEGYKLEIDPEYANARDLKNWEPSHYFANNPLLRLTLPSGEYRFLTLSPREPKINLGSYYSKETYADLHFNHFNVEDDGEWEVFLTHNIHTSFGKKETLDLLRDHGLDDDAANLEYLYRIIAETMEKGLENGIPKKTLLESAREIQKSWGCRLTFQDPEVSGLDEYVALWRSKKAAAIAGVNWIRVDLEFWKTRVFASIAKGINPSFEKWEFRPFYKEFSRDFWNEIAGVALSTEEKLKRMNALIQEHDREAYFESKEDPLQTTGCGCGTAWHLRLILPNATHDVTMSLQPLGITIDKPEEKHH